MTRKAAGAVPSPRKEAAELSWGAYFMLGTHMWRCPDDLFGGKLKGDAAQKAPDTGKFSERYRKLQCDDGEWRAVTDRMHAGGLNQMVIDIGEGLRFPSHPELAIEGSWTPDRMRDEVRRLRGLGIEPYMTAACSARGTPVHKAEAPFNTCFALALRMIGHDMKISDPADTGVVNHQMAPSWWPKN